MRGLLNLVLVLIAAVLAALLLREDAGYVLIGFGPWSVEMSLVLFVLLVLGVTLVAGLAWKLLSRLLGMPDGLRDWRRRSQARRARDLLNQGLIALAEGRWEAAEKTLTRLVEFSDHPLLNYLGAARAAQQLGAHDRRDRYLRLAHESTPEADIAVGLTQAELQLAHRQTEQALATLSHLRQIAPHHRHVLRQLMKLYRELHDWEPLRRLLPELRKQQVLDETEYTALERQVYSARLQAAAEQAQRRGEDGLKALLETWRTLPRHQRHDTELQAVYARALARAGAGDEAVSQLHALLGRRWQPALVALFGEIETTRPARQLEQAEGWLKAHGKDPVLLYALGRLCLRQRLWGKARIYLESSIENGAGPEAYRELGRLLEQLGDREAALNCYREGMSLADCSPGRSLVPNEGVLEEAHAPLSNQSPAKSKLSE